VRTVELTDLDRLILANQYEILGALKKDKSYEELAESLRNGHKWIYDGIFSGLADVLPEAQANFVLDVLGLFEKLQDFYNALPDKSGIESHEVLFPGFDGNGEGTLISFAAAIRKKGHYEHVAAARNLNAHMPTIDLYVRMLDAWRNAGAPLRLDTSDYDAIQASRVHPSDR